MSQDSQSKQDGRSRQKSESSESSEGCENSRNRENTESKQGGQESQRIALVTGGSGGIGRAICIALAEQGHDVAASYASNPGGAEQTVALCKEAAAAAGHQSLRALAVQGNVASPEGCEQLFQQTLDELGAPDILVNNAGITRDNLLLRMSVEDFDTVLNTNLRSAFVLSKLAARPMIKKRFGRIISISSVVGLAGNAGQTNYAASKAGLIGFTKSLAKELGSRSVTVNAVAPGYIETSMTEALGEEAHAQLGSAIALGRLGAP